MVFFSNFQYLLVDILLKHQYNYFDKSYIKEQFSFRIQLVGNQLEIHKVFSLIEWVVLESFDWICLEMLEVVFFVWSSGVGKWLSLFLPEIFQFVQFLWHTCTHITLCCRWFRRWIGSWKIIPSIFFRFLFGKDGWVCGGNVFDWFSALVKDCAGLAVFISPWKLKFAKILQNWTHERKKFSCKINWQWSQHSWERYVIIKFQKAHTGDFLSFDFVEPPFLNWEWLEDRAILGRLDEDVEEEELYE